MSVWHEIKDKEDVSLDEKKENLQVCFDSDNEGNIWVEIPLEFIRELLEKQ